MPDPDLEIRWGVGGEVQTLRKGRGESFGPQFGLKIRGRAPPLDPPLVTYVFLTLFNTGSFVLDCHALCLQDFISSRIY